MNVCGIVAEYNPFHRGHAHQIAETRRILGPECVIVCAMSGEWTQRGSPAVFSKHARAEAAVRCGVDLVLELPLPWSMAPAETFARGGVGLLLAAGAHYLSFGSECGDIDALRETAALLGRPELNEMLRARVRAGEPWAVARQRAAEELAGKPLPILRSPNDILALEYIKAIQNQKLPMTPLAIPRRGAGHDALNGRNTSSFSQPYDKDCRDGSQPSASPMCSVGRHPLMAPPRRATRGAECDVDVSRDAERSEDRSLRRREDALARTAESRPYKPTTANLNLSDRDIADSLRAAGGGGPCMQNDNAAEYPSAADLRKRLAAGADVSALLPAGAAAVFAREFAAGRGPVLPEKLDAALLSRLRALTPEALKAAPEVGEGLENRLMKAADEPSLAAAVAAAATKRYPDARLRRALTASALGLRAGDAAGEVPYLRVLAANAAGRAQLAQLRESCPLPIVTKPAAARALPGEAGRVFALCARAADLWRLACPDAQARRGGEDWKTSPILL